MKVLKVEISKSLTEEQYRGWLAEAEKLGNVKVLSFEPEATHDSYGNPHDKTKFTHVLHQGGGSAAGQPGPEVIRDAYGNSYGPDTRGQARTHDSYGNPYVKPQTEE